MIYAILFIITLFISIAALGIAIWAFVIARKNEKQVTENNNTLMKWIDEIKLRMGKLIQEINSINELEYNVDIDQQNTINKLLSKSA